MSGARLSIEQQFIAEAGRVAAHGVLATPDDLARLKRAMDAARPHMTNEIRMRIFDHCAEIIREGMSEARADALLDMLKERITQLTEERGPWYSRAGLMG